MTQDRLLNEKQPYRMQAAAILNRAQTLRATWVEVPMNIYVNDKLVVEGNLNGFTNPAMEARLMHCRTMLEFPGLCATNGVLMEPSQSRERSKQGRSRPKPRASSSLRPSWSPLKEQNDRS